MHAGAAQLHDDVPGNLAFEFESGDAAAVEAAFARARFRSKVTVESQRLVGNPMEPRACLAAYDQGAQRYTVHVLLQGVGGMRGQILAVTGLENEVPLHPP